MAICAFLESLIIAPFVVYCDPGHFEANYDFPSDDESPDPRFNMRLPLGLMGVHG